MKPLPLDDLSPEERASYLAKLTFGETLDLALEYAKRLDHLANQHHLSILDGLESLLPTHAASRAESDRLLASLMAR